MTPKHALLLTARLREGLTVRLGQEWEGVRYNVAAVMVVVAAVVVAEVAAMVVRASCGEL